MQGHGSSLHAFGAPPPLTQKRSLGSSRGGTDALAGGVIKLVALHAAEAGGHTGVAGGGVQAAPGAGGAKAGGAGQAVALVRVIVVTIFAPVGVRVRKRRKDSGCFAAGRGGVGVEREGRENERVAVAARRRPGGERMAHAYMPGAIG